MTASDILNIVVTVAVVQGICDLLAYWRVYRVEAYDRALEKRSRALFRQTKAKKDVEETTKENQDTAVTKKSKSSSGKAARVAKAMERADQDVADANAAVARFAVLPNFLTSVIFVVLMRVLGTEHKGKIMGLLPFVPFSLIHKLTGRGLQFKTDMTNDYLPNVDEKADVRHVMQACSFVFIYFLCGLSVKFYISRLLGVRVPGGAETIFSLTQSTWGQQFLRAVGVDPNDLKME